MIGEVELAWRLGQTLPNPPVWLAVTGTDGKTTTVGMLESILLASGAKAVACGNIGLPVIDAVLGGYDVLAVELSSYQLHWQSSMRAHAAAVLNVAEDHLEWHGSMAAYVQDKGRIYTGAGLVVYNADDVESERLAGDAPQKVSFTLEHAGRRPVRCHRRLAGPRRPAAPARRRGPPGRPAQRGQRPGRGRAGQGVRRVP